MKNIPVFMTPGGTATLILQEIPRSGRAYIQVQTLLPAGEALLLGTCTDFVRTCGARESFLSGMETELPHAYDLLRLRLEKDTLPEFSPVPLLPVTEENQQTYISVYNACFSGVSHALSYDKSQMARVFRENQQAFLAALPDGTVYGIGELHGNELAAVGVLPEYRGRGTALALTLLFLCPGPEITLITASDNDRALSLYDRLGFRVCGVESRWYRLI